MVPSRLKVLSIVGVLSLGVFLDVSHAITSVRPVCSDVFEGVVTDVSKAEAPFLSSNYLEKVRITFSVQSVLKGDVSEEKQLVVLKDGPVNFQTEKNYRVSLNNDLLCNVKEI